MGLLEELQVRKDRGEKLEIGKLSTAEIKRLFYDEAVSDRAMAELFEVPMSRVTYLRRKNGITLKELIPEDLIRCRTESALEANLKQRDIFFVRDNIDAMAKAITQYAFRDGPVEDMHADSKLSDEDMKTLNKFMVNRVASILSMMIDGRWIEFEAIVSRYESMSGKGWDKAEIDDSDADKIVDSLLSALREMRMR